MLKHIVYIAMTGLAVLSCDNSTRTNPKVSSMNLDSLPTQINNKSVKDSLQYIVGKFEPDTHQAFVIVEPKYADRSGMYLRKETYEAFKRMNQAAAQDGIRLIIRSAARNFSYQKGIWERKWSIYERKGLDSVNIAKTILQYSSMPSTSRHHWGTEVDLNAFTNQYFEKGEGLKVYNWLKTNASHYGFCQVYDEKGENRPYGYALEKWHWSYLPLADVYFKTAEKHLSASHLEGFKGAEMASKLDVISKYVLSISKNCK